MMTPSRKIVIIAGPNGAGKTTFAMEFLRKDADSTPFINADMIARGLSPFQPPLAAFQAGKAMLSMIRGYVAGGESFAFENTLSGLAYARSIPDWREQGYRIEIIFLRLPSPDIAVARVGQRVRQGGHHIPEETVRRRFDSGWHNFKSTYRDLADYWAVYDNSGSTPALLEQKEDRKGLGGDPRATDLKDVEAAMHIAAKRARQLAMLTTGTIVVYKDGEVVHEEVPLEPLDRAEMTELIESLRS